VAVSSVQSLVEAYRPAYDRCGEIRRQFAELEAAGVVDQEAALRRQLQAAMRPNWPYRWDDERVVIKRKAGLFRYKIDVVPGTAPSLADEYAPPDGWRFPAAARQVLQMALAAGVALAASRGLPSGCDLPNPFPTPAPAPDDAGGEPGTAFAAGFEYAKKRLVPAWGSTFVASGEKAAKLDAPAKIEDLKADHVARLREAVNANDGAVAAPLDAIVPPGTDPAKITAEQQKAYAKALMDLGAGMLKAAE